MAEKKVKKVKETEEVVDSVEETEEATQSEVGGSYKAVYRELLPDGTRKGAIAYRDFTSLKEAEAFVKKTGGKLV